MEATNQPTPVILDDAAVAEIEARANTASIGPWVRYNDNYEHGTSLVMSRDVEASADGTVPVVEGVEQFADAQFIAHARTDIPALCATVRALRAQVEKQDAIISAYENNDEEALAEAENL